MVLKIFIYTLLYTNAFSLIIYFKCQLFYVDDYVNDFASSEGTFSPTNPTYSYYTDRNAD